MELLDDSGNKITTESGKEVGSSVVYNTGKPYIVLEAFAQLGNNSNQSLTYLDKMFKQLGKLSTEYPSLFKVENFVLLNPINAFSFSSGLYNFGNGTNLTLSGDGSFNRGTISGNASGYFDTGLDPSGGTIEDINNWSMGIWSVTDENTSSIVDMGCTDGTNEHSISCRSGGNVVVKKV